MLVVAYKQPSSQVPPFFLEIDDRVLVTTAQELTVRVYDHFRRHLSPFITADHLQLRLPSGERLLHHLPLFLYFNYGQHFQTLSCEVDALEAIRTYHQRYEELFLSLVLRVSLRSPTHQKNDLVILSKGNRNAIIALNEQILPTDSVYITGKRITLTNETMKWSDLLLQKWEALENVRNRCLYICIDRDNDKQHEV